MTESNESNNVYAWTVNVVPGPITSLVIGSPNHTSTATYIRSSTPLDRSVTDQSGTGIKHTKYRTDNVTWNDYASPFFLNGDGDHYVEWYSEDNAGNAEGVNARVLRVDDVPPATTLSVGEPKYLVGGRFVNSSTPLVLSAVDAGVGSNSTFCRLWGGSWSSWREYTTTIALTGRDRTWSVEFLSYDFFGNREGVENETLTLDDTPPATTILPATGPYTTATTFNFTATDSGSGAGCHGGCKALVGTPEAVHGGRGPYRGLHRPICASFGWNSRRPATVSGSGAGFSATSPPISGTAGATCGRPEPISARGTHTFLDPAGGCAGVPGGCPSVPAALCSLPELLFDTPEE